MFLIQQNDNWFLYAWQTQAMHPKWMNNKSEAKQFRSEEEAQTFAKELNLQFYKIIRMLE